MSRIPSRAHPLTVGVVGLGAIGRRVCQALDAGLPGLRFAGATARTRDRAEAFLKSLDVPAPFLSLDELIGASEIVVEASTQAHLQEIAPKALGAGRDLVVLSCGALLGRADWVALAETMGARILVPSGAIGGLDAVKGGAVGPITSVTMESRKAPAGWAGAPWVLQQKIDLDAIREETLIFEGPATAACPAFPANVNVLAALSLAGIGPERTTTRIFAVPGLTRNTHRISVEGEFGSFQLEVRNVPSENPRTGRLSYLSTIALLRDLGATLRVGDLTTDPVGASFDRIAEQYAADFADELSRKPYDAERLRAFAAHCGPGPGLDVGCGAAGHVGRFVAEQGVGVIGVDLSPRSAALARRLNPALRFVAADVQALPFATGAATGLVAFYSLIYTADPTSALVEMRRVLALGAPLLVAAHAGAGAQHFDSYKGVPIDVELHLRSPEVLASQVRAAGFGVDRVEVRAPYPFEHASQRLYITAVAT